jgi:hypothetical protein
MPVLLYLSNLWHTRKKDINPVSSNQFLNRIFILLYQSQTVMKQFTQIYSPNRFCQKNLPVVWLSLPESQIRYFSVVLRVVAFSLMFFFFSVTAFSQPTDDIDPMPLRLKGQVLNLEDQTPVSNAIVINLRTHATISADLQGRFMMDMLNIDSLSITSLGFSKSIAHVPANYNEMNVLIIYAKPIRFALPDVNVTGQQKKVNMDGVPVAKKNDIAPELRGDAYDKKPPVIAALLTPASFLQYYLSKSEREKRETRKAIVSDKQWDFISQFYNKELVVRLTGMNNAQADLLMIYINSKGLISQMTNEYDVRSIIKEQYKLYIAEGH